MVKTSKSEPKNEQDRRRDDGLRRALATPPKRHAQAKGDSDRAKTVRPAKPGAKERSRRQK